MRGWQAGVCWGSQPQCCQSIIMEEEAVSPLWSDISDYLYVCMFSSLCIVISIIISVLFLFYSLFFVLLRKEKSLDRNSQRFTDPEGSSDPQRWIKRAIVPRYIRLVQQKAIGGVSGLCWMWVSTLYNDSDQPQHDSRSGMRARVKTASRLRMSFWFWSLDAVLGISAGTWSKPYRPVHWKHLMGNLWSPLSSLHLGFLFSESNLDPTTSSNTPLQPYRLQTIDIPKLSAQMEMDLFYGWRVTYELLPLHFSWRMTDWLTQMSRM